MECLSTLKLIDLLSLKPGTLLQMHAVTGEMFCREAEALSHHLGWQRYVSDSVFPHEKPVKRDVFSKLLDVPIETQVIIRHPNGKVVEILRLGMHTWNELLDRAGHRADIMVDGRIIAEGEVVDTDKDSGILIKKLAVSL